MTVLSFIKGILRFISLFGVLFMGIGAWKAWTAYTFAQHAEKIEGTFKGYHTVYYETTTNDAFDNPEQAHSAESLPMYAYTDAQGRDHDEVGKEGHFFEHLSYGDKVNVLVATDGSGETRLGDLDSLYGNAILYFVIGLCLLLCINYGIRVLDRHLGQPQPVDAQAHYLEQLRQAEDASLYSEQPSQSAEKINSAFSFFLKELRTIGQSRLPISDLVIILGGFLLVGGIAIVFTVYFTLKREDPALINALRQQNYTAARALATGCRGIEGKTAEGETALIAALRANQPDVARAILNCRFVNANVYTTDTKSAAQLAAANEDLQTLMLLFKNGASAFDIDPEVIHKLIIKGDLSILRLLFDNGFNLQQEYRHLYLGDYAVMEGQTEIVRLIQRHNGLFNAPEPFIALALNDPAALQTALKKTDADKLKFQNYSLERFAKKIDRQALMAAVRKDK